MKTTNETYPEEPDNEEKLQVKELSDIEIEKAPNPFVKTIQHSVRFISHNNILY
jgi:hypothetical protein